MLLVKPVPPVTLVSSRKIIQVTLVSFFQVLCIIFYLFITLYNEVELLFVDLDFHFLVFPSCKS